MKRGVALSSLHHVIDLEWMKEAYRLTRKDGAPGIDGVVAADYGTNLEANLLDLLDRIKSGRYKAFHRCCPHSDDSEGFSVMVISGLSRGLSTCCLRFMSGV